jgi:uncharacterized lipoprotein YajG
VKTIIPLAVVLALAGWDSQPKTPKAKPPATRPHQQPEAQGRG